jgi:hypothetical protein
VPKLPVIVSSVKRVCTFPARLVKVRCLLFSLCRTNLYIIGCLECSKPCASCSKTPSNCTSCINRLPGPSGGCVDTCPDGTFSMSGNCVPCSPDCAACSGGAYNQCTKCNPHRPVLDNNRCLPWCKGKNQFYNSTTLKCEDCHSSCSSCYAGGSNNCLACSDPSQFLQNDGSCSPPQPGHFVAASINWANFQAQ